MGLFLPRLSTKHMARLSFHLWSLYRGGTPLRRAFALLDDTAFAYPLRQVGREMAARLEQGETLASALDHVERRVPVMARNLLAIGEQAGGLERILDQLHRHYEKRLELQRKAIQLLTYPLLLVISFYIIEFVKGAVMTNQDLDEYVWQYVKAMTIHWGTQLAFIVMTLRVLDQWGYLKPLVDNITAHVPAIRTVFVPLALARFFRCFRLMLDSGCHVVTALEASIRGTSNSVIERKLSMAIPAVKDGTPVLEAIAARGVFPTLVRNMLVTGEFAGKSEENLEAAADYLEAEATTVFRLLGAGFTILLVVIILASILQGAIVVLTMFFHVYMKGTIMRFAP